MSARQSLGLFGMVAALAASGGTPPIPEPATQRGGAARTRRHGWGTTPSSALNRKERATRRDKAMDAAEAKRKRRRVRNARDAAFGGYR